MSKNRTTTHRGKVGNAKHNEHKFYSKDDKNVVLHSFIHQKENVEWDLTKDELNFYKRYAGQLAEQNQKYLDKRNYSRVKTLEEFYNSKRYKPTEEIIQYGHVGGDVPDRETYEKMSKEYARRKMEWSRAHGGHLHVLDYSNHYDESTPHTHLREIWDYTDENGVLRVAQEESMKRAGLELPDPTKPEGRYNNRSMTYTAMCREMWQDICEEYGYDVERVPLENGRKKSETIPEYHARRGRELEAREQGITQKEQNLDQREQDINTRETALFDRERALNDLEAQYKAEDVKRRKWLEKRDKQIETREQAVTQREQDVSKQARLLSERLDVYENLINRINLKEEQKRKALEQAESDRKYVERVMELGLELGAVADASVDRQYGE